MLRVLVKWFLLKMFFLRIEDDVLENQVIEGVCVELDDQVFVWEVIL